MTRRTSGVVKVAPVVQYEFWETDRAASFSKTLHPVTVKNPSTNIIFFIGVPFFSCIAAVTGFVVTVTSLRLVTLKLKAWCTRWRWCSTSLMNLAFIIGIATEEKQPAD